MGIKRTLRWLNETKQSKMQYNWRWGWKSGVKKTRKILPLLSVGVTASSDESRARSLIPESRLRWLASSIAFCDAASERQIVGKTHISIRLPQTTCGSTTKESAWPVYPTLSLVKRQNKHGKQCLHTPAARHAGAAECVLKWGTGY